MPALKKPRRSQKSVQEGYTFPGNPDVNSVSIRQVGTGFFSVRSKAIPGTEDVSRVTVVQAVTLEVPNALAEYLTTREVLAGLYGALHVSVPDGTFGNQKLKGLRKDVPSGKRAKPVRVPVK